MTNQARNPSFRDSGFNRVSSFAIRICLASSLCLGICLAAAASVSPDSLYFRVMGNDLLYSSAKVQNPALDSCVPMSFMYSGTVVSMAPAGDYVYEVYDTKLRRYSTADGNYSEYELFTLHGNGACGTDGDYVYVPSALQVWKVTPTGTLLGFNILTRGVSNYAFSVANDTVWTGSTGDSIIYGYACSKITGDSQPIAPDDSWNIGPGAGSCIPMNVAWDGDYYYVAYGLSGPPFTFKVFNRDRTLYSTGTVGYNTYSVMAALSGTGIRSAESARNRLQMSIAPNPLASRFAILRCSPPIQGAAKLSVFDAAGRTVLSRVLAPGEDQPLVIDLGRLVPGVYVARLSSRGLIATQKLVVER